MPRRKISIVPAAHEGGSTKAALQPDDNGIGAKVGMTRRDKHAVESQNQSASRAHKAYSLSPTDIVIAVMGLTGSGKSTLISTLTGQNIPIGHSLESRTNDVDVYPAIYQGRTIFLIDTPGFDDPFRSDTEVLKDNAYFLSTIYAHKIKIAGMIYLHRITDPRMGGSALKNIRVFEKLCGKDGLKNIVLATTLWEILGKQDIPVETGVDRESQLLEHDEFWGLMAKRGSHVMRHYGSQESAWKMVSYLVDKRKSIVLDIQRQLVDENQTLDNTSAGQIVQEELLKACRKDEGDLQGLEESLEYAIEKKDEEMAKYLSQQQLVLRGRIERAMKDCDNLKLDLKALVEDHKRRSERRIDVIEEDRGRLEQQSDHPSKIFSIATGLKNDSLQAPVPDHDRIPANTEEAKQYLTDWDRSWDEAPKEKTNLEPSFASVAEKSESVEDADERESSDSNMPKSRLARMQNQASRASPGLSLHLNAKSAELDPSGSRGSNLRTLDHERKAFRSELHRESFLALSNEAYLSGFLDDTEMTKMFALESGWLYDLAGSRMIEAIDVPHDLVDMLVVCGKIARIVRRNIFRLEDARLVGEFLSILILDYGRSNDAHQVAVLEKIRTSKLKKLAIDVLYSTEGLKNHRIDFLGLLHEIDRRLIPRFSYLLPTLGLPSSFEEINMHTERSRDFIKIAKDHIWFLKCMLEIIDIGLLVYEGAHCGSLDYEILKTRQETVEDDREIRKAGSRGFPTAGYYPVQLCRLRLKCLDAFLGGRSVWVFKHESVPLPKKPLYISTAIETFADVWGPVWKVTENVSQAPVKRYNVGGGSIFASVFDSRIHPPLQEGERLCHWNDRQADVHFENNSTPDESECSDKDEIPLQLAPAEPELLKESDRLLIGAHSNPGFRWERCHCETAAFKQWLKEAGRLDRIIASKAYRFLDSQQACLTVGAHGVTGALGRTFKEKRQEPLKKGILESWENDPLARDPREFENHWGVVVSLCTMNARRVRLSELLGEDSVIRLLRPFRWSDLSWDPDKGGNISHRRSMFVEAVCSSDPRALGNLWDANPTWQEELGKVLLMLLRILRKTGYDENRDEFHILWVPEGCQSPRRITLKATDQTWIRFLKDTTYSMTVAVIVEDSLGRERCCNEVNSRWFKVPSVLETAICVNESLNPAPKLLKQIGCVDEYHWDWRESPHLWRSIWDVSMVLEGERFWTGPEGRLRVIRPLTRWHLLLKWDPVMRDRVRDMVGMRPSERVSHWEFTDEEEMERDTRPIPVHITT